MFIKLPKEQKLEIAGRIKNYLTEEFSVEAGHLASEIFLDYLLKEISPYIYNQAVKDARHFVEQRLALLEEDLDALEIPLHPAKRK
ncbi:DUF2164 domain-containing protein [Pelotomaculum propionicicum]|uniref:DUF2164 domain-containing protein n=1 Tax=Pelotomaculum propionicicum TaxID=258475 RepID=A0A4Y7RN30_9FIRM|nr:DUF2164 domain-containing protein [Pelotomaculum propionicicum]NLI11180.1 DUF2164 domain-containing protein [Peptococcaceae bacterium]TEB10273.1 hypothetical protein Pmgp_02470 [Pelotomaculum propionicicum]